MNFSLYILGNPNGFDQYPMDSNSNKFQRVLTSCKTESQLSVFRTNQLIQYVYVRKVPSSNGLYFGFGLVLTGVYCLNCHTLNDLFDAAFYDVLMKGELLRFQKDKYNYTVSKFVDNTDEIKRINQLFKTKLENELGKLFVVIPLTFRIGKEPKTLSLKETASDINVAISQHDVIHLLNNEKSVSELERTQRMLSEMYSKHQKLEADYKKVLNQKRNFKLVAVLSLIIIACTVGFFLLYNLLNVRDSTINDLRADITSKNETIFEYETQNKSLSEQVSQHKKDISKLHQKLERKNDSIEQIMSENRELSNNLSFCQDQVLSLRAENLSLSKKCSTSSGSSSYETYEVYASGGNKAYCYYQCGNNYIKTDCYYSDFQKVTVYLKRDGYALTQGGYVKMMDIRK